jgi:methyl-accepting chemotaxis protein
MKNLTIKTKLLLIIISTIFIISIAITIQSIITINELSQANIEKYQKEAYKSKEIELKNYVSIAMNTLESYHQRTLKSKIEAEVSNALKEQTNLLFTIIENQYKLYHGKISDYEIKNRIKNIINATRYGKNGYFWVNDTNSVIVTHPIKPSLNNKNLSNFKDKNGKNIFIEFSKAAKENGSGFVNYVWPKPNFDKPQPKISFVKLFKPFNWVIGTGAYVNDVTQNMKKEAIKAISQMRYGQNGYFWINDTQPKMIMHPLKPSLNNKLLSNVKDKNGIYLFNEMVKTCQDNKAGLVKYSWAKPNKDGVQPKFSYVSLFKPWNWIIGTGAYVDDVNDKIELMKKNTQDEINEVIIKILISSSILSSLIIILISLVSNKIIVKPIQNLNNAIKKLISNNTNSSMRIQKESNDEFGDVCDNFNKYLQKIDDEIEKDLILIKEAQIIMSSVQKGDYSKQITNSTTNQSLDEFKNVVNSTIISINNNFKQMNKLLEEYSKYDYTNKLSLNNIDKNSAFDILINNINFLRDAITTMLINNKSNGINLHQSSDILLSNVNLLNESSNTTAQSLEETAASLEQITSNISNNRENVIQMSNYALEVTSSVKNGQELANKTTVAMDEIDEEVTSINDAISVIDQIAFQTNILSLNAAVEAATAGEAGKGFAVVAGEVRNLAGRSSQAANEIKKLVSVAKQKADDGKDISNKMIIGYNGLNKNISQTLELIDNVEMATKEQQLGIEQINIAINQLEQQTHKNVSVASDTNDIAIKTNDLANFVLEDVNSKKFIEK